MTTTFNSLPSALDDDHFGFDTLGGIRALLHGYSGGISILRELAQNADDVPGTEDRWLELDFQPDRLVVRNNTSFRDEDFSRIKRIAAGGKLTEQHRTTGTFGVGFVSVYQLTDEPVLRSSGFELRFLPEKGRAPASPCNIAGVTEFELTYRRTTTTVGRALGMDPVTDTWVDDLLERLLPNELPVMLLFTERLSRITILRHSRPQLEVHRHIIPCAADEQADVVTITATHRERVSQHHWLRFRGSVIQAPPLRADGRPEKDQVVSVVVPGRDVPECLWKDAGRLFNYQPTNINTRLPFHINGDFFPSTDRKNIDDGHDTHRAWNRAVIAAIGQCVADALPTLLRLFNDDAAGLYQRLPLQVSALLASQKMDAATADLVRPIIDATFARARGLPIIQTAAGWKMVAEARWAVKEIRPVVEAAEPRLVLADLQSLAWELIQRLKVPPYMLSDFVAQVQADVQPASLLRDGPTYLRTPKQIDALYAVLELDSARQYDQQVTRAPLFLDQGGRLHPASGCRIGRDQDQRECFGDAGVAFWVGDPQRYPRTARLLSPVALTDLWPALARQLPGEVALQDAPPWLNTRAKLYRLYSAIIHTGESINKGEVASLPLCLDRNARLRRPSSVRMPVGEPRLYKILADDQDAPLVEPKVAEDLTYRSLYSNLGVQPFGVRQLIDYLERVAPNPQQETLLQDAHASLNSREKLELIYRYLSSHREEFDTRLVETLRHRMRIWVCREDRLHRAVDVRLPPDSVDWPQFLAVDRIVPFERRAGLHPLFEETLGMKPLDTRDVIKDSLLPQYAKLDRKEQQEALRYLRTHTQLFKDDKELFRVACGTALLYGDDDQPHLPGMLCFPGSDLERLFPGKFRQLHAIYRGGGSDVGQWTELFATLGVNRVASAPVILETINQMRQQRPSEVIEDIERMFRYLESHWEHYTQGALGPRLRDLAWLPADGDPVNWCRPTQLYPRTAKALVDQVAPVLGLSAQLPKKAFADALGFPTADTKIAILQLQRLSERKLPPSEYLYEYLNQWNISETDLKQLRGQAVIYDRARKCFWRGDQVFLRNHRDHFGPYRCYADESNYRQLFGRLGARETPTFKDYVELIIEISKQYHGQPVPDTETQLLLNAYATLHDAPDEVLTTLRDRACVVSIAHEEERLLRIPQMVVLQPPDRYARHLPKVPHALYNARGESTLRRIGVKPIDDIMTIDLPFIPDHSRQMPLSMHLSDKWMLYAIERLLHHYNLRDRQEQIHQELTNLRAYHQRAIQVEYIVQLGNTTYRSGLHNLLMHYDRAKRAVYLDEGLKNGQLDRALAEVLRQVMNIEALLPALLKDLLADHGNVVQILDDNNIRPLPVPPELQNVNLKGDSIEVGVEKDASPEDVVTEGEVSDGAPSPTPTPTPPIITSQPGPRPEPPRPAPPSGPKPGRPGEVTPDTKPKPGPQPPIMPGGSNPMPVQPPGKPQSRPKFRGSTQIASPTLRTDWDGLRERVTAWGQQHNLPLDADAAGPIASPRPRPTHPPIPPVTQNQARFVLSFAEYSQGFLRLSSQAEGLFPGKPTQVICRTDLTDPFTLWLDWDRRPPIAYNQDALAHFFVTHGIPAGGIVYLELLHQGVYRLYFNPVPHQVLAVRLATNAQGQVQYETIELMDVNCETDEAIFRAEKRHEDPEALWLEAVNKRSVEETICDLLMAAPDGWIHENELRALVENQRMLAAGTVAQTLRGKPYFVSDGHGFWRLDPAKFLASPEHMPIVRWIQATDRLLGTSDQLLSGALEQIQLPFNQLRNRITALQQIWDAHPTASGLSALLSHIATQPDNDVAVQDLERLLIERITAEHYDPSADLELDQELERIKQNHVWSIALRPALQQVLKRLHDQHAHQRAYDLAILWAQHDQDHGQDVAILGRRADAWTKISGSTKSSVTQVMEALAIDPSMSELYTLLSKAVQSELHASLPATNTPQAWTSTGSALLARLRNLSSAHDLLQSSHRTAFRNSVEVILKNAWPHIGEAVRVDLALQLALNFKLGLSGSQDSDLIQSIEKKRRQGDYIDAFAIGQVLWSHITLDEGKKALATVLVQCCEGFHVWERANNKPWKGLLSLSTQERLIRSCQQNSVTYIQRENQLREQIKGAGGSPSSAEIVQARAKLAEEIDTAIKRAIHGVA